MKKYLELFRIFTPYYYCALFFLAVAVLGTRWVTIWGATASLVCLWFEMTETERRERNGTNRY